MIENWTVGVIILIITNIAVAAYGYGKLHQKVSDVYRRIERLEKLINGINGCGETDSKEVKED